MGRPSTAAIAARAEFTSIFLLLSAAAVLAYVYNSQIDGPTLRLRQALHDRIIEGTALSPYRYRVLVPFVAEALVGGLAPFCRYDVAFRVAYAICDLTAVSFALVGLFLWLREWFSADRSLMGALYAAAVMPIALQDHYYQPWSLPEVALFAAALLSIRRSNHRALAVIVPVAALNRETAVFIPIALTVTSLGAWPLAGGATTDRRTLLWALGLFAVWLTVFLGLRYVRGAAPSAQTIPGLLSANLTPDSLARTAVNSSLFLGAFWAFAVLGYRSAPGFIRRLTLIIPAYVVTVGLWGVWYEVRLLMPLYLVLVPLGLSFIYRDELPDRYVRGGGGGSVGAM